MSTHGTASLTWSNASPTRSLAMRSRPQLVERPWECDRLADVRNATDPRHRALQAEPEPRVHERAVFAEVQVPAVRVLRQPFRADAGEQLVVVVFTLAA